MRIQDLPEDDEEREKLIERLDVRILDYKPWNILEDIDTLLTPYGLEIVVFGDDAEPYYRIDRIPE